MPAPSPIKQFKRQTRNIVAAVTGTPWMLLESSLGQMCDFLSMRMRGEILSREDMIARLKDSDHGRGVCRQVSLNFDPQDDEDFDGPVVIEGGIAILPMTGILAPRLSWMEEISGGTSTELFAAWFQQALADQRVTHILCRADTPGGSASGNEELSRLIYAARGQKPATCVGQGIVASAGYYNARAFETFYASPSTEVGSVGCYMIHGESSKADEMDGYTYTVVKAGENKAAGNSVEPLTAKTKAVLQERITAFYDQFVAACGLYAGKTVAQVEAAFGQGKVMIAEASLEAGMIDGVMTFDEVLTSIKEKTPAGKPVRGGPGSVTQTPRTEEAKEGHMNKNIRAALEKLGLIKADATDDTANVALAAYCKAHGKEVPKSEAEILAILNGPAASTPPPAATAPAAATQPATAPTTAITTAPVLDERAIQATERARVQNIRASGELLKISATDINAAIDSGKSTDDVLAGWRSKLSETENPVGRVEQGAQSRDKLTDGILQSLQHQAGILPSDKLAAESRDLRNTRMVDMGKIFLAQTGNGRLRPGMDDEDVVKVMLGNGFAEETRVYRMSDAGYQRPGDFPGILSALMGKMLDSAQELTETTFRDWTGELPSVPDFKPKTIHGLGEFGELPEHQDAKPFVESTTSEEAAWLQVDEYGDNWSLTPRMILDDDLGALMDVAEGKQTAHDMTLERLCVNLLVGNQVAQDGNALFDATGLRNLTVAGAAVTQYNDIAGGSGGVPSTTQLSLMRKLLRKIYGVSGQLKLNQTVGMLLIPEDLETAADQLLGLSVTQVPSTETTTNVFRGRVGYKVVPMLSESSTSVYYGISTARRKAIVRCFQRGFENMRTVSYYDPKTNCRVWQFSGRFAAAIRTWRTIVRNAGA